MAVEQIILPSLLINRLFEGEVAAARTPGFGEQAKRCGLADARECGDLQRPAGLELLDSNQLLGGWPIHGLLPLTGRQRQLAIPQQGCDSRGTTTTARTRSVRRAKATIRSA
jgi:hypothetical protein